MQVFDVFMDSEERARALQEELRVLTVRLEALASLVQKLRTSHDQGLITDEEFNSLAAKHMDDIAQLEQEAIRRRLIVELFELEEIEEKLASAFSAKIAELNETTSLIRRKLGLQGAEASRPSPPPFQILSSSSRVASLAETCCLSQSPALMLLSLQAFCSSHSFTGS
jgi:vacuolar-type H+-ATPase subunit I/STV1